MRLTQTVNLSAATGIFNIGPFRRRQRPPRAIWFLLHERMDAGAQTCIIRAAVTDNRATDSTDLDGGQELIGTSTGGIVIGIPGTDNVVGIEGRIPVDVLRIQGKYIAISVEYDGSDLTGAVGAVLI